MARSTVLEHPLMRKLHADLAKGDLAFAVLCFEAEPMATDWTLSKVIRAATYGAAKDARARLLRASPYAVVELWERSRTCTWGCLEAHNPAYVPDPGTNVSPAQVPMRSFVGDGLRIWKVISLKAGNVPSAWENLPCLECYAVLDTPVLASGKAPVIKVGDVMIGFGSAVMLFIGTKKRADALFATSQEFHRAVRADVTAKLNAEAPASH